MPKASAPTPPLVQVWLSPQTSVSAGQDDGQFRRHDMDDAVAGLAEVEQPDARLAAPGCAGSASVRAPPAKVSSVRPGAVETAWSGVAKTSSRPGQGMAALGDLRQRPGAGQIVQQHPVDMQQRPALAEIGDDVLVPDLVEQRPCHGRPPGQHLPAGTGGACGASLAPAPVASQHRANREGWGRAMVDLVVRGDTVVTPHGVGAADIAIAGEQIVAVAERGSLPALGRRPADRCDRQDRHARRHRSARALQVAPAESGRQRRR